MRIPAPALKVYRKGLRLVHPHCLRCKDMLYLACTNAKRQGAKSAVGRSVTIATHYGGAWQGKSKLRADNVHYALIGAVHVKECDPKLFAVLRECLDLHRRYLVYDGQ